MGLASGPPLGRKRRSKNSWSIPIFANGQGDDCEQCHNAPPSLNAYGRYILATNFSKVLDAHAQMKENLHDPVSIDVTGNGSNSPTPGLPKIFVGLAQLLSGGNLGQDVTYYSSIPIIEDGFPSSAVDQLWGAYNGFAGGDGSLQVGKFPTPIFAPWLSQSLSLAGYSLGAVPIGLNTAGIGDNRWGASYTQTGRNGLIGNVAYLTNTGPLERAYNSNINSTTAGAEGQSFVASLQNMAINSHFTGGIAFMSGGFPLPSGATDNFTRSVALASYSASSKYDLVAMTLIGHDSNPNDGASPASGSKGWSFEGIFGPLPWLHLDARYERTNDGLGNIQKNYIGDIAISIRPNLVVTLEDVLKRSATGHELSSSVCRPMDPTPCGADDRCSQPRPGSLRREEALCSKLRSVPWRFRPRWRRSEPQADLRTHVVDADHCVHREPIRKRYAEAVSCHVVSGAGPRRRRVYQ